MVAFMGVPPVAIVATRLTLTRFCYKIINRVVQIFEFRIRRRIVGLPSCAPFTCYHVLYGLAYGAFLIVFSRIVHLRRSSSSAVRGETAPGGVGPVRDPASSGGKIIGYLRWIRNKEML